MNAMCGIENTTRRHNLFEVDESMMNFSQGSSLLATLGWRAQSLWDWSPGGGLPLPLEGGDSVIAVHLCDEA
jgi:hypothetical protein